SATSSRACCRGLCIPATPTGSRRYVPARRSTRASISTITRSRRKSSTGRSPWWPPTHLAWRRRVGAPSAPLRPLATGARSRTSRRCAETEAQSLSRHAAGRLEQTVPESKILLDLAFAAGESAVSQTAQLLKLLEEYGATALRRATLEALQSHTPRA